MIETPDRFCLLCGESLEVNYFYFVGCLAFIGSEFAGRMDGDYSEDPLPDLGRVRRKFLALKSAKENWRKKMR